MSQDVEVDLVPSYQVSPSFDEGKVASIWDDKNELLELDRGESVPDEVAFVRFHVVILGFCHVPLLCFVLGMGPSTCS